MQTPRSNPRAGWRSIGARIAHGGNVVCLLFLLLVGAFGCASTQVSKVPPPPASMKTARMVRPAEPPQPSAPTGSLWDERNESLFRDIKAHRVGDIVTIMVSEESQASNAAKTETNRERDLKGDGKFLGLSTPTHTILRPIDKTSYEFKFTNDFTGSGTTEKNNSMTAYMTATVIRVLPNGNLVIRGSRWTKVNDEMQQIILEGVIRPYDITRDNTVLSQNIADAKIFFVGKGPVTQHQKPSLLGQLLDIIF